MIGFSLQIDGHRYRPTSLQAIGRVIAEHPGELAVQLVVTGYEGEPARLATIPGGDCSVEMRRAIVAALAEHEL